MHSRAVSGGAHECARGPAPTIFHASLDVRPGGAGVKGAPTPLTTWLADELDDLAGNPEMGGKDRLPLTFGDLWRGPAKTGSDDDPWMRLQMMTTSLTHGRPHRLPFSSRVWFFDPGEFRELFPERVVAWMEQHPPSPPGDESPAWWELQCKLFEPLRPLPAAADLPVVVAARMSLSFPLLISAVPLHAVDWTRTMNANSKKAWQEWQKRHLAEWDDLQKAKGLPSTGIPRDRPTTETVWFSDGGITSNFPVHFFDAPIPRWPTFALNLRPYHEDYPQRLPECDPHNVWLPAGHRSGIVEQWTRIGAAKPSKALIEFGRAIADTMQNWTDNTQLGVPGYRDRVAHIHHTDDEGGLNLAMPHEKIDSLAERGRCAGGALVERFTAPGVGSQPSWDNHRWVRYRSSMTLLEGWLSRFRAAYTFNDGLNARTYSDLIGRGPDEPPTSYTWKRAAQRDFAAGATEAAVAMSHDWKARGQSFQEGTPQPEPELRTRPPT